MSIEQDISRCGGLEPADGPGFRGVTTREIEAIEMTLGARLTSAYSSFLLKYGACLFRELVYFSPSSITPVFLHQPDTGLRNLTFTGSLVSCFYGADTEDKRHLSLMWNIKTYACRMPPFYFPIADDGAGNQICLSLNSADQESVYYWDHENEWDEEDYADEVGLAMPAEAKFQNMYLLANSFSEFFSILTTQQSKGPGSK